MNATSGPTPPQSPTSVNLPAGRELIMFVKSLPLWVRHVLFVTLQSDLKTHFVDESLHDLSPEDAVALFSPRLTPEGSKAEASSSGDRKKLLTASKNNLMILDICLEYHWSLEQCCRILHECITAQWITPPQSKKAVGTIEYLANAIRLGEYLVKMGRISGDQLSQALRTQVYIQEAMNEHTGIANILINLGYITRKDTEAILFLKEESKQPIELPAFKH